MAKEANNNNNPSNKADNKNNNSNFNKKINNNANIANNLNESNNNTAKNTLYNLNNLSNNNQNKNQNQDSYDAKLKEVEKEIQLLKAENESVAKLKREYQKLYSELNEEIDVFYSKKESEIKEFERWKEEETKKLQREKKNSEKSGKLNQNIIPSKKDKEEIECLKNIIAKMQEEFKIKDSNNKLTIDKLKRRLDESNDQVLGLSKMIEEINHKNTLIRSNSTNLIKVNNHNLASSSNVITSGKRIINYNEANSINNVNNHSTNVSPSTQGITSKNSEEINSNKSNKSMNLNLNNNVLKNNNSRGNNLNKILNNNINNINSKQKYNSQKISEDSHNINSNNLLLGKKLIKKDSKDFKEITIGNNKYNSEISSQNANNKSLELTKKLSSDTDKNKQNTTNNYISEINNTESNCDDGVYDLVFLEKYHPRNDLNVDVIKHEKFPDGKIVKFYENDKREVMFPSGVRKEIFSDGYQIVYFNNKDVKQVKKFFNKIIS